MIVRTRYAVALVLARSVAGAVAADVAPPAAEEAVPCSAATVAVAAPAPQPAPTLRLRDGGGDYRLHLELLPGPLLRARDAHSGEVVAELASDPGGGETLPAELSPAAVLTGADGYARRVYFGDGAGVLWRLDLAPLRGDVVASAWRLQAVADLGEPRRFTTPELVPARDSRGNPFVGVVLVDSSASGTATELIYLRDRTPQGEAVEALITSGHLADLAACGGICLQRYPGGWRLLGPLLGRRAVGRPLVAGGRIFLSVYRTAAAGCDGTAPTEVLAVGLGDGAATAPRGRLLPLGEGLPREAAHDDLDLLAGSGGAASAVLHRQNAQFLYLLFWRDLLVDAD